MFYFVIGASSQVGHEGDKRAKQAGLREHRREQGAESREQGSESREQRAESREQRAESRGERAESREQRDINNP
jgi:hypothetical protein